MSEAMRIDDPPVSIAEFDAFVDAQRDDTQWELVAGRIVAMTNPTEIHETIVSNIGVRLAGALDAKSCRVYFGGMRVQRSDNLQGLNKTKPDLVVRCGPPSARTFVTDPLVVVEVLSPSTIDVDRGEKLRFYKALPTLRHIALVYQDQVRIEHYRRGDTGWDFETLQNADFLRFEAVAFEMPVEDAYFGIPFDR
jgi:Uma2 family endonuclease